MSKTATVILIIILIIILGAGAYYLLRGKYQTPVTNQPAGSTGQQNNNSNGTSNSGSTSTSTGNQEIQIINIQNFAFNPVSVTIKVGTTVKWVNNDSTIHTIKSGTFNSGNLNKGNTFDFKFTNVGVYDYTCGIHSSMRGTIIVEQ